MGGVCSAYRERRGVYSVLVGKPEGKRTLWRPRRRWEHNIKMCLEEVVCGGTDWIELAQDRDRWRSTCECGNEHSVLCKILGDPDHTFYVDYHFPKVTLFMR